MQPGDVPATWADVDSLVQDIGYTPTVKVQEGVERFIRWYLDFFNIQNKE
jgi:UDP-glucuronate 4-epimerase